MTFPKAIKEDVLISPAIMPMKVPPLELWGGLQITGFVLVAFRGFLLSNLSRDCAAGSGIFDCLCSLKAVPKWGNTHMQEKADHKWGFRPTSSFASICA